MGVGLRPGAKAAGRATDPLPATRTPRTAELLEGVCDVDLDVLDIELPRGFGRD